MRSVWDHAGVPPATARIPTSRSVFSRTAGQCRHPVGWVRSDDGVEQCPHCPVRRFTEYRAVWMPPDYLPTPLSSPGLVDAGECGAICPARTGQTLGRGTCA
ncbi:DUF6255 family natural product biosynthesis protein [Streptomyces netropsis]|uniref:DUF6255 family natural product biosynthesis protein n=1 Tax=Streptomyces netropsis TaxID=55404 RepID=UPI0035714B4F